MFLKFIQKTAGIWKPIFAGSFQIWLKLYVVFEDIKVNVIFLTNAWPYLFNFELLIFFNEEVGTRWSLNAPRSNFWQHLASERHICEMIGWKSLSFNPVKNYPVKKK